MNIFEAINEEDIERTRKLITLRTNVNQKNNNGRTHTMLACIKGNLEIFDAGKQQNKKEFRKRGLIFIYFQDFQL